MALEPKPEVDINQLAETIYQTPYRECVYGDPDDIRGFNEANKLRGRDRVELLLAIYRLIANGFETWRSKLDDPPDYIRHWDSTHAPNKVAAFPAQAAIEHLWRANLPWANDDLVEAANHALVIEPEMDSRETGGHLPEDFRLVSRRGELHDSGREAAERLLESWADDEASNQEARLNLQIAIEGSLALPLAGGEHWSDFARGDVKQKSKQERQAWHDLVAHAQTAKSGGKPSPRWTAKARPLIEAVGEARFCQTISLWFDYVDAGASAGNFSKSEQKAAPIKEPNQDALKGLAWIASLCDGPDIARGVGTLAVACFRKIPITGARSTRAGNAAIYALEQMESDAALAELATLRTRVKHAASQKLITRAYETQAKARKIDPGAIEDVAVPTLDLNEVGIARRTLGEYTAELTFGVSSKATITWFAADGSQRKTTPKAVKDRWPDDVKALTKQGKDIAKMVSAQRARVEQLYFRKEPLSASDWQQRYIDHPLVGVIGRALIWTVLRDDREDSLIFSGSGFVTASGKKTKVPKSAKVELWHPLTSSVEEVLDWRRYLEDFEITQPFKQAHREVYTLTDAEKKSRTYSNRFAAHVIRQHQLNALAHSRGWKASTFMMNQEWNDTPTKVLADFELRAEFWVEGAGSHWHPRYVLDSGAYRYFLSDRVAFFKVDAKESFRDAKRVDNEVPLARIPRRVFSELMREVDLFVGVGSIGNVPDWNQLPEDTTPQGYHEYWHDFSFGELSASANTRKAVLERLVPRLKIADRCSFSDRFLIVRGDVHIHLGSGNIQMEPNNEYLCIVPNASINRKGDAVTLPFEGDRTLSIILSKALLLAEDTKIKDSTILSQIGR